MSSKRLSLPSWVMNLLGFGVLIALVIGAFGWQMFAIQKDLYRNTRSRAQMMAAIIEKNLENGELATTTIDTLVANFLGDKARFVAYLNDVDPLQGEELEALARETGLLGLSLVSRSGITVSGPTDWLHSPPQCPPTGTELTYDKAGQRVLYSSAQSSTIGCIVVGMDASTILTLQQKSGLAVLLNNLTQLPGIEYLRMEQGKTDAQPLPVRLLQEQKSMVAEVRLETSRGLLVLGLDATNHHHRVHQLQRQFLFFTCLLLGLGIFFSWVLYRVQQRDLERTRHYDHLLAKEHEAAALGRATATIAHEVRNPLNAINMGLQRIVLESDELTADQQQLIAAMKESVRRAGYIITELQRFTRPLVPRIEQTDPRHIIERVLLLYQQQMDDQSIKLDFLPGPPLSLHADVDLLAELVENLLRNAIEAQLTGGFIRLQWLQRDTVWQLNLTSGGFMLSPEETARLGEPYFTTKTRGTGLGLALCHKIAEAHGGSLELVPDFLKNELTIQLILPCTQG
nr:HAMP domain-containing sensor histidine kinase [uncultured Desulfobulbus sp.]